MNWSKTVSGLNTQTLNKLLRVPNRACVCILCEGYNRFRQWCGMKKAATFEDLVELPAKVVYKFRHFYESVFLLCMLRLLTEILLWQLVGVKQLATYIFFSKNYQSLISLCITSSLESTSCLIPPALHKTPCWWCHSLIHLPPAHPPSRIHCFIPGSKLTFSINLFHHSLLAPTYIAFSI